MSEWVKVASAGDVVQGEVNAYTVGERVIAVANIDGDLFAFDDSCTHQGCSLSEGTLESMEIECPCHGGRFDITSGEVVGGPPPEAIDCFEAREEDGELQIQVS